MEIQKGSHQTKTKERKAVTGDKKQAEMFKGNGTDQRRQVGIKRKIKSAKVYKRYQSHGHAGKPLDLKGAVCIEQF